MPDIVDPFASQQAEVNDPFAQGKGIVDPFAQKAEGPKSTEIGDELLKKPGESGLTKDLTREKGIVRGRAAGEAQAVDLMDMVLGFPGLVAKTLETGMLSGRFAGEEGTTKNVAEFLGQEPAVQQSTAPIRSAAAALGNPMPPSQISKALSGGVQNAQERVGELSPRLAEATPALTDAVMAYLGARAAGKAAEMPPEVKAAAQEHTAAKIKEAVASGATPNEIATEVLKNAAEKGIDTSAVSQKHIEASIEDIAKYYGSGIEKRMGDRATPSQLEALKEPPKAISTALLDSIKLYDRATDLRVDTSEVMDSLTKAVRSGQKLDPITITVSTKDNLAFMSDGAHRVAIAKAMKLPNLDIRIEQTDRSFSGKVKDVARDPKELGLTPEQIKAAPWEAGLEAKPKRVTPEEINFGNFQKEFRQEKAAAKLDTAKVGDVVTPMENKQGLVPQLKGEHFSQAQREVLSGGMFGTGAKAQESVRLSASTDPRIKSRISFYIDEGQGVHPEQGVGSVQHSIPLNNLYDASKNPLKLPTESFMYGETAGPDFNRFESAVLDAGFDGYYIKGAFGRQGAAVLMGDAAKAVKVAPKGGETMLNVGLNTNDGVGITRTQVEAELRNLGVNVVKGDVHVSDTEPTFAARLSRPLTPEEAHQLSINLKQEAIAQTKNGKGEMFGPAKDKWGPFNPEYFITPEGKRMNEGLLGSAFKQRGAIGNLYTRTLQEAIDLADKREGEVGKKTDRGYQVTVPMDAEEAMKLPQEDQINLEKSAAELYKSSYFKKQLGAADKQLIANVGLVLGGATFGAALSPGGTTEGLLLGAAIGFGAANLPRATRAISDNWKGALKTTALGVTYAGVGAYVDKNNPVEGLLVGSAMFGLRFLPATKLHPEDDFINARNGNIAAEKRLTAMVSKAMEQAVPDKVQREQIAVLAENPKFTGRTPAEKLVVDAWRGLSKSYHDMAVDADVKMGFIEGYVSHIIDREGLPQSETQKIMRELFGQPQTGLSGKAKFTKERAYPTFESLEKALEGTSLKLKTKDIAEITKIYSETMTRTIENQKLLNNLKEATLNDPEGRNANLLTTEQQPGYVKLPNPQLLPYYVHPDVAPALRFVFDSRNHNELTNGLVALNRATKRINVVGSFFHAKSLLEAYSLAGGNLFTVKGAVDQSLKLFHEGGLGDELDKGMRAGLRVEMPTEVSPQALQQVGKLADMYASKMLGKDFQLGEKVGGKIEAFQTATFDKFTWDYLHTGLKTATYLRLMEDYKLGEKGKGMSEDVYRQGVASHINDTFGGLDWYRVVSEAKTEAGRKIAMGALKPSARDFLGVAIFAPDWTVSTIRAMTKALPGGAKNPANVMLARQYALRTAALYASVIAPINYAISGHWPWSDEQKDPTRIDLGDGTNLQVVKHSMEFSEWVRDPMKTFSNKMGFLPRTVEALRYGKQYPGGPPVENRMGFVAAQVAPFTARSFQGDFDPTVSAKRAMLGMFGISVYGMSDDQKELAKEARKQRKEQVNDPFAK